MPIWVRGDLAEGRGQVGLASATVEESTLWGRTWQYQGARYRLCDLRLGFWFSAAVARVRAAWFRAGIGSGELGPDSLSPRMGQPVQDRLRPDPGGPRGMGIPGGIVELAVRLHGQVVMCLGLSGIPQLQLDIADGVQGVCRAAEIARFMVQAQRLLTVRQCLRLLA